MKSGSIEGAAAEIVDDDGAGPLAIEAVSQGRRRRLVYDSEDIEPRDAAGVAGRLALRIVEVRGHRDDGLDRVPRALTNFAEDHGRQFFRSALVPGDVHAEHLPAAFHLALDDLMRDQLEFLLKVGKRAAHKPLHTEDGVLGIGKGAFAGGGPDEHGAVFVEADGTRNERDAVLIAHGNGPTVLDVRRETERGA